MQKLPPSSKCYPREGKFIYIENVDTVHMSLLLRMINGYTGGLKLP